MVRKHARKSLRVFDLFCGGGGSSRGAVMAGGTPVGALDVWELAADTYKLNFSTADVYRTKASSASVREIAERAGKIDLLLASPECTSHSVAKGGRPGCEKSRETAFEVIRFAEGLKPRWLVVENVMQMRRWQRFDEWVGALQALGYKTKVDVLDARYFETPQSRRRLFVIGDMEADPCFPKTGSVTRKTVASSVLGCGESKARPWRFSPVDDPRRAVATVERARRAIDELGTEEPFIMVYYGNVSGHLSCDLSCPDPSLARGGLEGTFGISADGGDEAVGQGEFGFGQCGLAATLDHVAGAGAHAFDVFRRVQGLGQ